MCFLFIVLSHVWRIHYKRKAVGCHMGPRHVCAAWCGQVCVIHGYSVVVWGWWPATGLTRTGARRTRLNLGHINHTAISSHQPKCLFGPASAFSIMSSGDRAERATLSSPSLGDRPAAHCHFTETFHNTELIFLWTYSSKTWMLYSFAGYKNSISFQFFFFFGLFYI